MITLNPTEVRTLIENMARDDESQVRTLALTDPARVQFADERGEEFSAATVCALAAYARTIAFHCYSCETRKPITEWSQDSSGLDLCEACMVEAEWENTHSDYDHENTPDPACPICREAN